MSFYLPTRVYEEADCVKKHAKEIAAFGKKALLVTGRSSAIRCGAQGDVLEALAQEGISYEVFSEVEENPSVETVVRAADFGLKAGVDFVIGIGGGSPMDASKAIAFLMKRGEVDPAALYDKTLPADALPVIAIPTTCGTGSEVTGVSVLTLHEKKTKASIPHRIYPALALVDGKYLAAAPASVLRSTAVDALAHMVESFESKGASDFSKSFALYGLSLWGQCKEVLLGEKEAEEQDLSRLMMASTFAGMAIAHTGTGIPHALSYILTYEEKVPHGVACGVFLPAYLSLAYEEDREKLLHTAGFESLEAFRSFLEKVLPRPKVSEAVRERAITTVAGAKARMENVRFPEVLTEDSLRQIMEGALLS